MQDPSQKGNWKRYAALSCSVCSAVSISIWDTHLSTSSLLAHTSFSSLFDLADSSLDCFGSIFNLSTCSNNSLIIQLSVDWAEDWCCFILVYWLGWNLRSNKSVFFLIALSWDTVLYPASLSRYLSYLWKYTSCFSWEICWEASPMIASEASACFFSSFCAVTLS